MVRQCREGAKLWWTKLRVPRTKECRADVGTKGRGRHGQHFLSYNIVSQYRKSDQLISRDRGACSQTKTTSRSLSQTVTPNPWSSDVRCQRRRAHRVRKSKRSQHAKHDQSPNVWGRNNEAWAWERRRTAKDGDLEGHTVNVYILYVFNHCKSC